ncbi:hypothetical protein MHBO_001093 [Bonamia ostreae]|uniref:histone deacetylase n=1 Tax=Bonamia ostreae TaxID=126728 RepID=A0ABV2AHS2_9EUKA
MIKHKNWYFPVKNIFHSDEEFAESLKTKKLAKNGKRKVLQNGSENGFERKKNCGNRTGLAFDEECLFHFGNSEEPENPERYDACLDVLTLSGLKKRCFPIIANSSIFSVKELIKLAHTKDHMEDLFILNERIGEAICDSNNNDSYYESVFTINSVKQSVAQCVALSELVIEGKLNNGFCMVRPPGHHCDLDRKYGFCHVNNIAIAIKNLQAKNPEIKILVFDWDLHHGNGTEDIFYDDDKIVYISVHQEFDITGKEMFPGTGGISDVGGRSARGRNVNIPVAIGSGDGEFRSIFDHVVSPILKEFAPDAVFVSSGFDSAGGDLLGLLEVTPRMFHYMTERLIREQSNGKVLLFLEGGYNAKVVAQCAAHCISGLLGDFSDFDPKPSIESDFLFSLDNIIRAQRVYWKSLYNSNPLGTNKKSPETTHIVDLSVRKKSRSKRRKKLVALKRYRLTHPEDFDNEISISEHFEEESEYEEVYRDKKVPKIRPLMVPMRALEIIDLTEMAEEKAPESEKSSEENGLEEKVVEIDDGLDVIVLE